MRDQMSPLPLPAPLLTAEEVAEIMNVDIRTVRRRIKDKTLPIVRFGRLVRIRREILVALIKGE
jgi:excisionase family DNA binding protein